ncbi:MAG: ABC transporter ATP-binding protein [Phycisphaerales bacterium JB063]
MNTSNPSNPPVLTHVDQSDREKKQRPLSMAIIRRLWGYTSPHARTRNTLIGLVILRGIQLPAMAWCLGAVLNGPVLAQDMRGVWLGALGFLLLALSTAVVFHYRMKLALGLGEAVVQDLRGQVFDHLQDMSMSFYDRTKLGRIISRITSDAEAVRLGVQNVVFVSMVQVGMMVVSAAIMLWYDPPLFLVVLAMGPLLWWVSKFFRDRLSVMYRATQESYSRVTATLAESINGIRVTQGFVRQDVNAELFGGLVEDHADYHVRSSKLQAVFLPFLELNSQFFMAVLLALGGVQVLRSQFFAGWAGGSDEELFGALVVFALLMPQFFNPIATIGRQYNDALTAMAGAERVFGLLDTEPERLDDDDAVELPRIDGRVELEDVTFGYLPGKPVLHGISFVAEPGQTVALVGHTGSGKTSIISLIAKFYLPTSGKVLIDGYDTRKVTGDSLARQLGIVLQSNYLFSGNVMDNIRIGRPDATDDEVVDAARELGCLDIFESLSDGLMTDVGEKGGSLSLGQRQLVCFCRAMLADPRVLILDEATSAVDTMTEQRVQSALSKLLAGRTSFVVAHRLSTIRHAGVVLVLEAGRIVERGSHAELLEAGGRYAHLYRQFIRASEA